MTIPTSLRLRSRVGLVDKIANFGSWPPTQAYRDSRLQGQGILLNLHDPDAVGVKGAAQILGIRSHRLFAGVWQPVPPSGDDGALRAKLIDEKIDAIDTELAKQGHPKIDCVGLNLEGYTVPQIREFLWGRPGVKGWRGSGGVLGSSDGYRSGIACWWIDEPYKDGTVKPMQDLMAARMMLAVEEFAGAGWAGDMTPVDGQRTILDRVEGRRSDGSMRADEAWPTDQVVACYDAGRGVEIRYGLHFTLDRARQFGVI